MTKLAMNEPQLVNQEDASNCVSGRQCCENYLQIQHQHLKPSRLKVLLGSQDIISILIS